MKSGKIFSLQANTGQIRTLEESGYLLEIDLQNLIAGYPDLLAGDQIDPENPRRWLLVTREMGVPGAEHETGRWSLDHLFIDQDGIPTLVECKRASDTRSRREVVAQMLDYAANGVEYWNIARIRGEAAETAGEAGFDLDERVVELLEDPGADIEQFWFEVADNLASHKLRLIFAADQLPLELRRLIEFLNEEMARIEVLGLEVRQFAGEDGGKVLVPRIFGATESTRTAKRSSGSGRKVTREEFMNNCTPAGQAFFSKIIAEAAESGFSIDWGQRGLSIRGELRKGGGKASFLYGVPPDELQFYFYPYGILNRDRDSEFRKAMLAFGLFQEKGDYTLSVKVDHKNDQDVLGLFNFICDRIKEVESETAGGLLQEDG